MYSKLIREAVGEVNFLHNFKKQINQYKLLVEIKKKFDGKLVKL